MKQITVLELMVGWLAGRLETEKMKVPDPELRWLCTLFPALLATAVPAPIGL